MGGTALAQIVRLPESSPRASSGTSRAQSDSAWSASSSSSPPAEADSGSTSPRASQIPDRTSHRNAAVRRWLPWLTEIPIDPRPIPSTCVTRQPTKLVRKLGKQFSAFGRRANSKRNALEHGVHSI